MSGALEQAARDLRAAQRRGQRARALLRIKEALEELETLDQLESAGLFLLEQALTAPGTPIADCVRQLREQAADLEAVSSRLEALARPAPEQSAGELIAAGGLGRAGATLGRWLGFGGVR